jgi:hypothetical protein
LHLPHIISAADATKQYSHACCMWCGCTNILRMGVTGMGDARCRPGNPPRFAPSLNDEALSRAQLPIQRGMVPFVEALKAYQVAEAEGLRRRRKPECRPAGWRDDRSAAAMTQQRGHKGFERFA